MLVALLLTLANPLSTPQPFTPAGEGAAGEGAGLGSLTTAGDGAGDSAGGTGEAGVGASKVVEEAKAEGAAEEARGSSVAGSAEAHPPPTLLAVAVHCGV